MTDAADGKINPCVFSGDHIFQHPLPRAVRSAKKTFNSSASSVTLSGASPKDRPPLPPSHTEGAGARPGLPPHHCHLLTRSALSQRTRTSRCRTGNHSSVLSTAQRNHNSTHTQTIRSNVELIIGNH